jgi:hypothetical protein
MSNKKDDTPEPETSHIPSPPTAEDQITPSDSRTNDILNIPTPESQSSSTPSESAVDGGVSTNISHEPTEHPNCMDRLVNSSKDPAEVTLHQQSDKPIAPISTIASGLTASENRKFKTLGASLFGSVTRKAVNNVLPTSRHVLKNRDPFSRGNVTDMRHYIMTRFPKNDVLKLAQSLRDLADKLVEDTNRVPIAVQKQLERKAMVAPSVADPSADATKNLSFERDPTTLFYKCPHEGCSFDTDRLFNLKDHYLSHMGEGAKLFACSFCNLRFRRRYDVVRHAKSKHKSEVEGIGEGNDDFVDVVLNQADSESTSLLIDRLKVGDSSRDTDVGRSRTGSVSLSVPDSAPSSPRVLAVSDVDGSGLSQEGETSVPTPDTINDATLEPAAEELFSELEAAPAPVRGRPRKVQNIDQSKRTSRLPILLPNALSLNVLEPTHQSLPNIPLPTSMNVTLDQADPGKKKSGRPRKEQTSLESLYTSLGLSATQASSTSDLMSSLIPLGDLDVNIPVTFESIAPESAASASSSAPTPNLTPISQTAQPSADLFGSFNLALPASADPETIPTATESEKISNDAIQTSASTSTKKQPSVLMEIDIPISTITSTTNETPPASETNASPTTDAHLNLPKKRGRPRKYPESVRPPKVGVKKKSTTAKPVKKLTKREVRALIALGVLPAPTPPSEGLVTTLRSGTSTVSQSVPSTSFSPRSLRQILDAASQKFAATTTPQIGSLDGSNACGLSANLQLDGDDGIANEDDDDEIIKALQMLNDTQNPLEALDRLLDQQSSSSTSSSSSSSMLNILAHAPGSTGRDGAGITNGHGLSDGSNSSTTSFDMAGFDFEKSDGLDFSNLDAIATVALKAARLEVPGETVQNFMSIADGSYKGETPKTADVNTVEPIKDAVDKAPVVRDLAQHIELEDDAEIDFGNGFGNDEEENGNLLDLDIFS